LEHTSFRRLGSSVQKANPIALLLFSRRI
jgi:hypothetical protein